MNTDLVSKLSLLGRATINSWLNENISDPEAELLQRIQELQSASLVGDQQLAVTSSNLARYEEALATLTTQIEFHESLATKASSETVALQQANTALELEQQKPALEKTMEEYRTTHQRLEATVEAVKVRLLILIQTHNQISAIGSIADQLTVLRLAAEAEDRAEQAENSALHKLDVVEAGLQVRGIDVPAAESFDNPAAKAKLAELRARKGN